MGEGLVPTAPLINMYLGLLCSKVIGGEGGGGVVCTVPCCWVPTRPSMGYVTASRRMMRFREMPPSSWPTPPTAMLSRRCCCGCTEISTLEQANTQAHTCRYPDRGSNGCTKMGLWATRCTDSWGSRARTIPSPSLQPSSQCQK